MMTRRNAPQWTALTRRIVWNTLTGWGALLVNGLLTMALVPALIGELGVSVYGLAMLVTAIAMVSQFLDLGFREGIARQLAAAEARGDLEESRSLVVSSLVLLGGLALLVVPALAWLAEPLARAMGVPDALLPKAVLAIRIGASVAVGVQLLLPVFAGVITSRNRFDLINMGNSAISILRSVLLLVLVVALHKGFLWWIYVLAAEYALRLIYQAVMAFHVKRGLTFSPSAFRTDALRSVLSVGGYTFLMKVSNLLSTQADPFILSRLRGVAAVTVYSPALQLVNFARPFVEMLNAQLHPLATELHERGQVDRLRALLTRGTRYGGLMGTLTCVFLFVYAEPLCRVWLGGSLPEDHDRVAEVLRWWVVFDYSAYLSSAQWPVILGMNRLRFLVVTQVPLAVVNLVASVALVATTDLGVEAVVIPTALIALLRRPILFWYCNRITGTSWREFCRESLFPLARVGVGLTLCAVALLRLWEPEDWTGLVASAALLAAAWAGLSFVFGATPADRALLRGAAGRLAART
jgi:O-antigen/teichoic acid export membrane protein